MVVISSPTGTSRPSGRQRSDGEGQPARRRFFFLLLDKREGAKASGAAGQTRETNAARHAPTVLSTMSLGRGCPGSSWPRFGGEIIASLKVYTSNRVPAPICNGWLASGQSPPSPTQLIVAGSPSALSNSAPSNTYRIAPPASSPSIDGSSPASEWQRVTLPPLPSAYSHCQHILLMPSPVGTPITVEGGGADG